MARLAAQPQRCPNEPTPIGGPPSFLRMNVDWRRFNGMCTAGESVVHKETGHYVYLERGKDVLTETDRVYGTLLLQSRLRMAGVLLG